MPHPSLRRQQTINLRALMVWKVIVDKNAHLGSMPIFSLRPRVLDRVSVIVDRWSWIGHRGSMIVDRSSWIDDRGSVIVDR